MDRVTATLVAAGAKVVTVDGEVDVIGSTTAASAILAEFAPSLERYLRLGRRRRPTWRGTGRQPGRPQGTCLLRSGSDGTGRGR